MTEHELFSVYEKEVPRSHSDILDYVGEDYPELEYSYTRMLAIPVASAGFAGALNYGLENFGFLESFHEPGMSMPAFALAGFAAGLYGSYKLLEHGFSDVSERRRLWSQAQKLEESNSSFEEELKTYDYVVVEDEFLSEEPVKRPGYVAAGLYREAVEGSDLQQFVEEIEDNHTDIDIQISLVEEDNVVRSFYLDEDLRNIEDIESVFEGSDFVSLEEYC